MTKIGKFEAIDRCLFWKEKKILIVGDLHLGYEDFLSEHGWSFPKTQIADTMLIFEGVFKRTGKLKEMILLGDVKHHFAGILGEEFSDFRKLVELFNQNLLKDGKIIIVKGNHDTILAPVISRWGYEDYIQLVDEYLKEDVLFFHGDKHSWAVSDNKKAKTLVVGHFHPAVTISEGAKREVFKCFLQGKLQRKEVIIVPSFFTLVDGTPIRGKLDKWLEVSNFKVYVVADKVYSFGNLKDLD